MIREVVDDQQVRARWVTCDEAFGATARFSITSRAAGCGILPKCPMIRGYGSSVR